MNQKPCRSRRKEVRDQQKLEQAISTPHGTTGLAENTPSPLTSPSESLSIPRKEEHPVTGMLLQVNSHRDHFFRIVCYRRETHYQGDSYLGR